MKVWLSLTLNIIGSKKKLLLWNKEIFIFKSQVYWKLYCSISNYTYLGPLDHTLSPCKGPISAFYTEFWKWNTYQFKIQKRVKTEVANNLDCLQELEFPPSIYHPRFLWGPEISDLNHPKNFVNIPSTKLLLVQSALP